MTRNEPVPWNTPNMTATLDNDRIALIVPDAEHYRSLRQWELSGQLAVRWRHRGLTPSPPAFEEALWAGVIAQYLVAEKRTGLVSGIVAGYDANFQSGYAHIAAAKFDASDRSLTVAEGCLLLVDHVFKSWPLRKLYFSIPEFNLPQIERGLRRFATEEARLRNHVYAGGRFWEPSNSRSLQGTMGGCPHDLCASPAPLPRW